MKTTPGAGTIPATSKAGLVICALLGLTDLSGLAGIGADDGPPLFIILSGVVLGLITLIALPRAWRGEGGALNAVVASRVVSAILGLPVFFVDDAPDWAPAAVGIGIALTVVAVVLIYAGRRVRPAV